MNPALFKDESGKRYGRITVVERISIKRSIQERAGSTFRCMCDCGAELFATGTALRAKLIKECPKCDSVWEKVK